MVHSPGRGAWLQANQHGLWTRRLGSSAAWDQLAFLRGSGAIFPSITWPLGVHNAAPAADRGGLHYHDRNCNCNMHRLATPLLLSCDGRRVHFCGGRPSISLAAAERRGACLRYCRVPHCGPGIADQANRQLRYNTAFSFSDARRQVTQQLEDKPGMHLVLVSYDLERHYPGNELVHNGAEFNAEKILWARSKGPKGDLELCQAYSDRTFWSVTTDDKNVSLNPLDLCK